MESTIVIGGGLMGSATAWHLVQKGESVILLEQQDSIYSSGSSYGEARISRSLGPVDDIYAYLQMQGIEETKKLIDFLNTKEPQTHSMEDIYTTSPVTYIFYPNSSEVVAVFNLDKPDTLAENTGDSIVLAENAEAIKEKFNLNVPDSLKVIREYRRYSGTMNPRELIRKLHLAISYAGGEVRYNQKVKNLHRTDKGYELTISDAKSQSTQKLTTSRIVAAAGPYNGKLLQNISPAIDKLITPKRLFLAFLKIKPEVYNQLSEVHKQKLIGAYPVIKLHSELFYSMIEKYDSDGVPILKVGGHFKRTSIHSLDEVWTLPVTDSEIAWSMDETIDYFNINGMGIRKEDLKYFDGYSCVYSLTKSEVPLVINLPIEDGLLDKNAVLVGGMSGVGAKGCMTYGQMAASLLLDQHELSDRMYQLTQKAIGNERLKHDLNYH
ncbi:NAD(P)/FAD-dependent oxidoreductase [Ekhidna sp.]|uniref:NAD(P)/FAD-dependent oxidoreductase n=1 Tax=Ekhidna sp. TaxID=2608089 RepID=UPI003C7D6D08